MKTFYQSDNILKVADILLVDSYESRELVISKDKISIPFAVLGFSDNTQMVIYAPTIKEVNSRFKNYLDSPSHRRYIPEVDFNDLTINSVGMLISDTLDLRKGYMINLKSKALIFSDLVLRDDRLNLKRYGRDFLLTSYIDEWIIAEILGSECSFQPSEGLLNHLWDFTQDEEKNISEQIRDEFFVYGEKDFRKEGQILKVVNGKFKYALLFEICDYLNNKGGNY